MRTKHVVCGLVVVALIGGVQLAGDGRVLPLVGV